MKPGLPIHTTFTYTHVVRPEETVPRILPGSALESGEAVIGSASVMKLFEAVCWDVMTPFLQEDDSRVGWKFSLLHVSPALAGEKLTIVTTCLAVKGSDVSWYTSATNDDRNHRLLATMRHRLRVISRSRFHRRLYGTA